MIRCCSYEFCAREFTPVKREQGGGVRQRFCSRKCTTLAWRWLHAARHRRNMRLAQRRHRARRAA